MRFIAGQDEIQGTVKHKMSNFRQKQRKNKAEYIIFAQYVEIMLQETG
jgi:hypothetical protein